MGVRMGLVWDRTVDVLQGRSGILARLAILFLFVPGVVSAAVSSAATPGTPLAFVSSLASIAASIILIAGVLAITAVASDPEVDAAQATRIAFARLLPALGAIALVMVVLFVVMIPITLLIMHAGATFNPATGRFDLARASGSALQLAGVIGLLALIVGLWLTAKIAPLFAVIVNERRGLGAFARSFRLTRGSTLRLVGVIILYGIVVIVAVMAATLIAGIAARLLLGPDAPGGVTFVTGVASSAVTALLTVVQTVFYARFYVAAREHEEPVTDAPLEP
ncbi:hypothetical protein SAMN05216382_1729 [Sphingomonas palmae]|uniref:DUF7847 domain-containing protein n=2 Tax=Sphingomonas palmae TaxID=1855283 RepID=A0A1H7P1I2_9SPHN|nr:hypothetical protein SAMN05216382_1729 [Sphingomonas palmae]